jgi:5-methylcytosine-specific restriction protein B
LEDGPEHLKTAKLVQLGGSPTIEYHIHVGPMLKALALAYAGLKDARNVLLVIDEINRGNCAQIFGDVFQLLDRDEHGWSEYGIELSAMFLDALKQELLGHDKDLDDLPKELWIKKEQADLKPIGYKLRLPPNLSLIGTMNTSDESVYYMDTAFKRRWDFSFLPWQGDGDDPAKKAQGQAKVAATPHTWHALLCKLNNFIAAEFRGRRVDDKQVGLWFIKALKAPQPAPLQQLENTLIKLQGDGKHSSWATYFPSAKELIRDDNKPTGLLLNDSMQTVMATHHVAWPANASAGHAATLARSLLAEVRKAVASLPLEIPREAIRNKLMFFLWDNVFTRDSSPLDRLLQRADPVIAAPRTFGEFVDGQNAEALIAGLMAEPD